MRIISLCGNIGAGKSTVIEHLGRRLDEAGIPVVVLPEPVEEWCAPIGSRDGADSMLGLFYKDMSGNAMAFQMYVLLSRTLQLRGALAATATASPDTLVLIERGPWVDLQLMARSSLESGSLSEMDWLVCERWHDFILASMPSLYAAVYVRTNPEECMRRILTRGRSAENMDRSYIDSIHDSHEAFFNGNVSSVASKSAVFENAGCPSACADSIFDWIKLYSE
jgi:deoxyadenosine/deoxycytidine kinase